MKTLESPTNPHAAGKAAHTPRFYTDGSGLVYDRENAGRVYATAEPDGFDENTAPETAAFIVRACNSHAALVRDLARCVYELKQCQPGGKDQDDADIAGAIELAQHTLIDARATGQGEGQQ